MKKVRNDDLSNFIKLVYITSENRHSLVFEYQIENVPRVLFTADSLISIPKPYADQIIITAPHHGSESNSQVYSQINGGNLIWIRSDRPSFTRPCSEFLKLESKYCLSCTKTHPIKREKISFEFSKNVWTRISGICCNCL